METLSELFASLDNPALDDGSGSANAPAAQFACDGQFTDAAVALRFMTAGNARVTLRSRKTGTRFTYRIRTSEDGKMRFVSLMNGPDNETAFQYFGHVRIGQEVFWHGKKSKISADAPSAKAFAWVWKKLQSGCVPDALEIWHEGRCGRCGRALTVPESVQSGFGPECINRIG